MPKVICIPKAPKLVPTARLINGRRISHKGSKGIRSCSSQAYPTNQSASSYQLHQSSVQVVSDLMQTCISVLQTYGFWPLEMQSALRVSLLLYHESIPNEASSVPRPKKKNWWPGLSLFGLHGRTHSCNKACQNKPPTNGQTATRSNLTWFCLRSSLKWAIPKLQCPDRAMTYKQDLLFGWKRSSFQGVWWCPSDSAWWLLTETADQLTDKLHFPNLHVVKYHAISWNISILNDLIRNHPT